MLSDEYLSGFKAATARGPGHWPKPSEGAFDGALTAATPAEHFESRSEAISRFQRWAAENLDPVLQQAFRDELDELLAACGEAPAEDVEVSEAPQARGFGPPGAGQNLPQSEVKRAADSVALLDQRRARLAMDRMRPSLRVKVEQELSRRAADVTPYDEMFPEAKHIKQAW
jgi:hypothetical protein